METCGVENLFVPAENGAASTIRPQGDYDTYFKENAMCRYRMIFPPKAGEFDQINIRLQRASNVKIYLTETSTYKSLKFKENIMEVETSLTVNWPNEAFILVLADETEAGADFTLSY